MCFVAAVGKTGGIPKSWEKKRKNRNSSRFEGRGKRSLSVGRATASKRGGGEEVHRYLTNNATNRGQRPDDLIGKKEVSPCEKEEGKKPEARVRKKGGDYSCQQGG